ncbi:hypothetical protein J41TS12_14960 [Paenibacillus antibioticophila]|uniref:CAAX prenyl protease 2/Lysostaphin resistance protein A-like domain-containing protein n=1 Tax=Paenibacillus antibioticophila TaxID=1274374 RepID=A0A919XUH0_9BACL|nr:CPBP family intramembrane glutamic endopeptidase [Paenibacillus antibioticophila]GIO36635.1 hypothetical protein J41TS12_14960 [Paenibacillus antibioticophila]
MKILKNPYWPAIGVAVLCTFFTALGSAIAEMTEAEEAAAYLIMAGGVAVSALLGLLIMKRSGNVMKQYGFRLPDRNGIGHVWMYVPLFLLELVPVLIYGFHFNKQPVVYMVLLLFTLLVGLNEELYFRGLVVGYLNRVSTRTAIIGSSVIFGALHAVTALNGKNLGLVLLQVGFAFLAGLVLVQIVVLTKSLWPGILWHIVHNFLSFSTEDVFDEKAILVVSVQVILLLVYAIGMGISLSKRQALERPVTMG